MSCMECRIFYKDMEKPAPCDTCWPGVHWINKAVYTLYSHVQDQVITMGEGSPFTLNVLAIDKIMDYFQVDIEERLDLSAKVRELAGDVFRLQAEERARKIKEEQQKTKTR